MSNIYRVIDEEHLNEIFHNNMNKLVIITFTSKINDVGNTLKKCLIELASNFKHNMFIYIDIDQYKNIGKIEISNLPTTIMYVNWIEIYRVIGNDVNALKQCYFMAESKTRASSMNMYQKTQQRTSFNPSTSFNPIQQPMQQPIPQSNQQPVPQSNQQPVQPSTSFNQNSNQPNQPIQQPNTSFNQPPIQNPNQPSTSFNQPPQQSINQMMQQSTSFNQPQIQQQMQPSTSFNQPNTLSNQTQQPMIQHMVHQFMNQPQQQKNYYPAQQRQTPPQQKSQKMDCLNVIKKLETLKKTKEIEEKILQN